MKKRGFTLIEIIVCIALIAVIGTVSIVSINRGINVKGETKLLEKNADKFITALEIYLSNHTEVIENINNNVKAAVVSLELLKNEGLIKDDLDIDYKNNYFTLTNAVLLKDETLPEEGLETTCANQIEIKTFANWELNDNSTEVIYICPRNDGSGEDQSEKIDALLERIESLEQSLSLVDLGGKNYILFDVNSNFENVTSWPEGNNQDLWAIIKTNTANKELKLLYNQNLVTDNSKGYESETFYSTAEPLCNSFYSKVTYFKGYNFSGEIEMDNSKVKYLDLNKNSVSGTDSDAIIEYEGKKYLIKTYSNKKCHRKGEITTIINKHQFYDGIVKFSNNDGWGYDEIVNTKYNKTNSKKSMLYNSIDSKIRPFILEKDYKYYYSSPQKCFEASSVIDYIDVDMTKTYKDIFGTVDKTDNINNVLNSFTGLKFFVGKSYYAFLSGTSCKKIYAYRELSNGTTWISGKGYSSFDSYNFDSDNLSHLFDVVGNTGRVLQTTNYIPVITIKYNSILNNIEEYPERYKDIYSDCTTEDLGTKSCPKIVKFSNGLLSWGN